MQKIILLLFLCPYLLAIQCFDDECALIENWEQNSYISLVNITPLQNSYNAGDSITLSAIIPATNNFFGETVNLLEETGDETGLLKFIAVEGQGDLFQDNEITINRGNQGQFPVWFEMTINSETGNYELNFEITLNRTGSYTMLRDGSVDFGASDCPDYRLNFLIAGTERQFLEFSVNE